MKKVTVELDDFEYLEAKRLGKTHREIFLNGLGMDYTPRPIGRPPAFDVAEAEQKMREIYLDKIRRYNQEHADSHEANLRELGHDLEAERPSFVPKKKRG